MTEIAVYLGTLGIIALLALIPMAIVYWLLGGTRT